MRLVLRATVDEFTSPDFEPLFRALSIESLQDPRLQEQIVERIYRPQFAYVEERFRSAREAGQIRQDVDLTIAFELFMAPMFYRWQSGAEPLTHDHADAVVDLVMRALAP
ncbi:TetR-like C-terminal domain-containing protein [Rhodococcus tibetensis]|uniref:TetR/AcrR family transcriptional regulator C-terminal ligand-binding domain-containing protein n=1 Tax=Rhodococcus tibetensis TaxID=2965064 RepID=A0ABT1Q6K4_9NOCA|nr:TetR-like C-terminal domain-containing protein [Rhodococcus sp. FXJ9.536]MCQ4117875.1 TetR/AcrR family transcriptional regulator C-terminal ligand-binding domain-containing protein [Rhodococcus sp. FXJ9.536]